MKRSGFTLIEIVLAMALVVVLLGLLGVAADVYLRFVETSYGELEGAQSARIALKRIAEDLHNAIPMTVMPFPMGGVVGDRHSIQMEISRMPLLKAEMEESEDGGSLESARPSDVRTVHYRIMKKEDLRDVVGVRDREGLARVECERAALASALEQGEASELDRMAKIVAPEIETIAFSYFEGETEYEEWDSTEKNKLPTAVRISVALRPKREKGQTPRSLDRQRPPEVFETLVDLPNLRTTLQQALGEIAMQTPSAGQKESGNNTSGKPDR